jgi:hypothetical protein
LGKFRVVPEDDLARFGYQGNYTQMASDIRSLSRQGLVEQRTIPRRPFLVFDEGFNSNIESSSASGLRRTSTKPFPGCGPTKTLDTKESS